MNIHTLQQHLWDIPLSFEDSGWYTVEEYNAELENYDDWSDIETKVKSFLGRKSSIKEVRELIKEYFDAPSMSDIILGCECGRGGISYTYEQYDSEERLLEKAMKKLKKWSYF